MSAPSSYLYVPGDSEHRVNGAVGRGSPAVIADLEDSVAPDRKGEARACIAAWLSRCTEEDAEGKGAKSSVQRWARVNPGDDGLADIEAIWSPSLYGLCLAKADDAAEIGRVVSLLTELEGKDPSRKVAVMPLIESAASLSALREIASTPRVTILQLGEVDLAADLRLEPAADGIELLFARSSIVMESRASGLEAPIGGVHLRLDDAEGLERSSRSLRRLGFGSRTVVHPRQIDVVNSVFQTSEIEFENARQLVAQYEASIELGRGVYRDKHGEMVDEAVVLAARRLLNEEENGCVA